MATVPSPVQATAAKASKRESCARCQRPPRVCYCASLPPVLLATTRTHVLIVQHRHEKRHRNTISSVPVLTQVLDPRAVTIAIVDDAGDHALGAPGSSDELDRLLYQIADANGNVQFENVLVLFPNATAKTLNAELLASLGPQPSASGALSTETGTDATANSSTRPQTLLVVIDGTWTEAKKIVFHTKTHLEALAKQRRALGKAFEFICLDDADGNGDDNGTTPKQSIYGDLRREPMEGCLSTLEAVALALQVLELSTTSHSLREALLTGFQGMVAIQTQFMNSGKQQTLERYNGVSKRDAMLQQCKSQYQQQERQRAEIKDAEAQDNSDPQEPKLTLTREYVFFTTHVDFRQRRELVQQGTSITCSYDEARVKCQELNQERKRGQRLAVLPLESFLQQQQQQQNEQQVE